MTGEKTNLAVLTYEENDAGTNAIKFFNNTLVDSYKLNVEIFKDKTEDSTAKPSLMDSLLIRRLYLLNLPKDVTSGEI